MLKSVTIENVRGKSGTYALGRLTRLLGRNEVGKSTIKEAICYAFAGTDSIGTRAPVHLITAGTEGLKVVVTTDRTTLTRTLTAKRSQSLSVMIGGVRVPLSQEQLSEKLGASPDLFLTCFLPGYFMRLSEEKRRAVLAEVMPPVDRLALLGEITGLDLTCADLLGADLTKRPDLAAAAVAKTRRALSDQRIKLGTEIRTHHAMAQTIPVAPPFPKEAFDRNEVLDHLQKAWNDYKHRRDTWNGAVNRRNAVIERNTAMASDLEALRAELNAIKLAEVPAKDDSWRDKVRTLRDSVKPPPARPFAVKLPDSAQCPACGQTVGSKHREHVKEENAAAMAAYEKECEAVKEHNHKTLLEVQTVETEARKAGDARDEIVAANNIKRQRLHQLEAKVSARNLEPVPEPGPEPEEPGEVYDYKEHLAVEIALSEYWHKKGAYDKAVSQMEEAAKTCAALAEQLKPLGPRIERYEAIEAGILQIPARELALRAEQLTINGYTFALEGTSVTRGDGIPYALLSTGAGMKADMMLCLKFNTLLGAKAPNVIFLDNADLLSDWDLGDCPLQVLAAFVRPEITELTLEVK